MVEPDNQYLSITAQCRLLSISRSGYYYAPVPENGADGRDRPGVYGLPLAHGSLNPADPAVQPTPVAVAYAYLNLGSTAGQAALHRRIAQAAAQACLNAGDGLCAPRAVYEQRACRARAMSGAEIKRAARGLPVIH